MHAETAGQKPTDGVEKLNFRNEIGETTKSDLRNRAVFDNRKHGKVRATPEKIGIRVFQHYRPGLAGENIAPNADIQPRPCSIAAIGTLIWPLDPM